MKYRHRVADGIQIRNENMNKLLNDEELETVIAGKTAPKVEKSYIESRIKEVKHFNIIGTVTICNITLDNGYSVRGESICVSPENFDVLIGRRVAYDNAFNKLWPLFDLLLAEHLFKNQVE